MPQNLDIIACAGFMRIMTPVLHRTWAGRMINIHPSLLPLYKGLHTHERALADGAKVHGCTVHLSRTSSMAAPVILQAEVPVLAGDTPDTLVRPRPDGRTPHLPAGACAGGAPSGNTST